MNKTRIKNRLNKVFDEWTASIRDKEVRKLVRRNSIITGGAITSLLMNQEPHDYDIYFTNFETTLAVVNYYVDIANVVTNRSDIKVLTGKEYEDEKEKLCKAFDIDPEEFDDLPDALHEETPWYMRQKFHGWDPGRIRIFVRSSGVVRAEETPEQPEEDLVSDPEPPKKPEKKGKKDKPEPYRPKFISSNAITLSDKIQLINRFYGPADKIHETFDFVHCHNYWTSKDRELVLNADALEAILDKRLVYKGSKYPLCTILRMRKFLKRGWTINAGQIVKACFQLSKLDLSDVKVLEDQLVGVDTTYFRELIERIQGELRTVKNLKIDETYVATLIDEIFG